MSRLRCKIRSRRVACAPGVFAPRVYATSTSNRADSAAAVGTSRQHKTIAKARIVRRILSEFAYPSLPANSLDFTPLTSKNILSANS